jgi:antigen flippase
MLLRAYASSFLPIAVKVLAGILLLRIFVEELGKAGLGQISQYQGFCLLIFALLNAAFFNHAAQSDWGHGNSRDLENSNNRFRKLLGIVLITCLIISGVLILLAEQISFYLFDSQQAKYAIYALAISCPFTGLFVIYSGRACADGRLAFFNSLNAIALLLSTLIIYLSVIYCGKQGAFYGLSFYYLSPFLLVLPIVLIDKASLQDIFPSFKELTSYPGSEIVKVGFIGIFSAINSIFIQMFLRNQLSHSHGWPMVGDWQAITKISESYLLLATAPLATFLLPQLSKNYSNQKKSNLILKSLIAGVVITLFSGLIIYFIWNILLVRVIGESFIGLRHYFLLQMIGDVFKIIGWTFSVVAIARKNFLPVLISEIIFTAIYIICVLMFVPKYGLYGAITSYVFSYVISTLFIFAAYKKELKHEH